MVVGLTIDLALWLSFVPNWSDWSGERAMSVRTTEGELTEGPVDLDHLKEITFDDPSLEREVLGLFGEHASAALIAIERATGQQERADAAHRLVGAARAIGAVELAEAAERIEKAKTLTADAVGELARSMAEVIAFLEARMAPSPRQSDAG